jgi:hypothetical protein
MTIPKQQVLSSIDAILKQLEKDIAVFRKNKDLHEDTILALEPRIRDYQALQNFVRTEDKKLLTPWLRFVMVDAHRRKIGKKVFGEYSKTMRDIILPYLTETFFAD